MAEERKREQIEITIDSKQMKALIEANQVLQREKEALQKEGKENAEAKEKLDLIATNAFEKRKRELSAPDSITTVEELKAFEAGKLGNKQPQIPAGCVPLESQYSQADFMKQSYANSADLVRDLREKARTDPRAKAALDALFLKGLQSGQPIVGKSEGILLKDLRKKKSE